MTDRAPETLPYRGTPGIEAWEIDPRAGDLHVSISREPPPAPSQAVETQWEKLAALNPRMFDGPVLNVLTFDPERNEILARRDGFKRLSVQPQVATGVRILAVSAIIAARDTAGREYVLLGRRAPQTRIYGGMWELGPSGGVSVPPLNVDSLNLQDLCHSIADEISEEVGLSVASLGTPVAYVRDLVAHSDDLTIRFSLGRLEEVAHLARPANWEYTETVWMPVDSASQFDTDETIAASRATFRVLGWLNMH